MYLFQPVNDVLAAYNEQHGIIDVPIKADLLKPIFENLGYVETIYFEELHIEFNHIIARITTHACSTGVYRESGTYARIQLSSGQSPFWKRFALTKEMYQCILDREHGNRITSTVELLRLGDHFTNDLLDAIADESEDERFPPFDTDQLAVLMALETLFPIELRRHYFDQYDADNSIVAQLAIRFQIPIQVVEMGMNNASYTSAVLRGRADHFVI